MAIVKLIRQAEISPARWAGGQTIQLLIFPENSTYADRNFTFRVSTATVETENSTFTRLEGVKRSLLILKGSLKLEHKGHYTKELQKFEIDHFLGDWESQSEGKGTDFNLMTTGQAEGRLESAKMEKNSLFLFKNEENYHSIVYYVLAGLAQIEFEKNKYLLRSEELIWIQNAEKNAEIRVETQEYTEWVRAFIHI